MKIFKKILAGVVSAAVIVSALAVPTAAAITAVPQTKNESGTFKVGNRTYSYGGDLVASTTNARATMSSGHSMPLYVSLEAYGFYLGTFTEPNSKSDVLSGTSVTVTADNHFIGIDGTNQIVDIAYAYGKYKIGKIDSFTLSIS